jgi:hypothetical protein
MKQPEPVDATQLVARMTVGDRSALDLCYASHSASLFGMAVRMLGSV